MRRVRDRDSSLDGIASWVHSPEPSNGTVLSPSPWITRVGMPTMVRSSQEAVVPNAVVHEELGAAEESVLRRHFGHGVRLRVAERRTGAGHPTTPPSPGHLPEHRNFVQRSGLDGQAGMMRLSRMMVPASSAGAGPARGIGRGGPGRTTRHHGRSAASRRTFVPCAAPGAPAPTRPRTEPALRVLRSCLDPRTGSGVAAPTTSLPESPGHDHRPTPRNRSRWARSGHDEGNTIGDPAKTTKPPA